MASAYEGDSEELRIVLLGVSGAGKSSIGNAILGREAFKETKTIESEKQRGRVEDRNISIIDTPGFFNTHLTDEELQEQMMKSLCLSHPGPHVFLLIVNLENFEDDQRNVMEEIEENFGPQVFKFTMVLFIGREIISRRDLNQIIESENTQKIINHIAGKFHVMNSKSECSPNQITKLLKSIDEMVKNNGEQNYSNEIYLKITKLKEQKERRKLDEVKVQGKDTREQKKEINPLVEIATKSKGVKENHSWGKQDLRVVLLGFLGSGKSSAGNTILGRTAFTKHFILTTFTSKKQETAVSGRTISIIDTPGLSAGTNHSETEIQKSVEMSAPGPHVFLLVISLFRLTDKTMKWFRESLEEDVLNHSVVLFTHADWLRSESLDEYIKINSHLQALIDRCGGRYHLFNNKAIRDHAQVIELLMKMDELVEKNGGRHYTRQHIFKRHKSDDCERL